MRVGMREVAYRKTTFRIHEGCLSKCSSWALVTFFPPLVTGPFQLIVAPFPWWQ